MAYSARIKRPPTYFKPDKFKNYLTRMELAIEVGKDPSWILKLERAGRIPKPPRVERGQLRIRLYPPEMVEEIRSILGTIKPGNPGKQK